MIDASSGGSEAGRSDNSLSDASDPGYKGAGEFAVINDMNNNAAAIGEEEGIDEDDMADDDEGAPPPDGDDPTDGVAPAVARPRGRGPPAARAPPLLRRWHAMTMRLLPRRLHTMAVMAKCLCPVGQQERRAVRRRAAPTMTTMAVFLCQILWG